MHNALIVTFLWALTAVFAYPLKRSAAADIQVLGKLWAMWAMVAKRIANHLATSAFANVLEQLESAFYTQALTKFNASSFGMAGFAWSQIPIQQIETIASDENTHATTLQVCETL